MKNIKAATARQSWKTLWPNIECLSADLDNETAVSSSLTEIKPDLVVDDAQYNLVSFLAKDFWLKECRRWKIGDELDGKGSSRFGFQPQTDEEIVAWEIVDDKRSTAV